MTRVSVVGTGYVGLVTGACLAELGHNVVCVDVDHERVEMINRGQAPFFERDLPQLLQRTVGRRLSASIDLESAVIQSELTFVAVGTPSRDGRTDLSYVQAASSQIGKVLAKKKNITPWS